MLNDIDKWLVWLNATGGVTSVTHDELVAFLKDIDAGLTRFVARDNLLTNRSTTEV